MTDGVQPELRLTDVDRDQVVSQLGRAMSEGRLDVNEFEERSRAVYAAKVPSDLTGVLAGLPATEAPVPVKVEATLVTPATSETLVMAGWPRSAARPGPS